MGCSKFPIIAPHQCTMYAIITTFGSRSLNLQMKVKVNYGNYCHAVLQNLHAGNNSTTAEPIFVSPDTSTCTRSWCKSM